MDKKENRKVEKKSKVKKRTKIKKRVDYNFKKRVISKVKNIHYVTK